jgi:CubicO group peptidase (beta-lactamase class C family)/D-alanyl-D-alanine dipeptidase
MPPQRVPPIVAAAIRIAALALLIAGSPSLAVASTDYAPAIAVLERFIEHEMADKELPALSIALVDDQTTVWSRGFGFADGERKVAATADTVYRVGSVSKLFTDIAVMQLVERGEVDLDAPVSRYLSDFRPANPFGGEITPRLLMSHRSGLVREPPVGSYFDPTEPTLRATIESLNPTTLVYAPGTRTKYSNAAIATLGYLVERVRGEAFAQSVKRTVLDPLGMTHSSFVATPEVRAKLATAWMWTLDGRVFPAPTFAMGIDPAGALYTTVGDLGRFWSALFAGGRGTTGQILEPATLERMLAPQSDEAGARSFGLGFGLGELDGKVTAGHGGAVYGFATTFRGLPREKLGVVVVTTKDAANAVTGRVADAALRAMLAVRGGLPVPEPQVTTAIDGALARRLAGRYRGGAEGFDLTLHGDRLMMLRLDGGMPARVRALGGALMIDDRLAYGPKLETRGGKIRIADRTFTRERTGKPPAAPEKWRGLIGEYGWDHDVLYILERDRRLWALIEWFEHDPLEEVSENVFAFPERGLYDGERLVFTRDASGRATKVEAAGIVFERRRVGPEEGAAQLRIEPVRPVQELLAESLTAKPPVETGDFRATDLVELVTLDPTIELDVRYATTDNFLSAVFYPEARAFLQRPAAEALVRAHRKLRKQGYGLLVHDGYRPWHVTKVFWEATPDDKKIFVADPAQGSRHNRGCAVDLSLYSLATGEPIEMVGTYDEVTDRSYPDYPGGTSLQRWHRELLRDAMESEGFTVYEAEWWHFDYRDWRSYPIGNQPFPPARNARSTH